ncbi:hypothetical protein [Pseudohalocynthiibacter sp. F2068]|jgi:hypothetical protein|uniref:hypothetical protein n=1 Tax=Pseudohalocynthiibacter sp. F2068 TaxID=2926418 RepID=UPI001FF434DF|nr:hypothetical protein [Pseudohalocynthiibacter sp. F2068]MCK0101271.1 hypothetical protein [Pseudohalocynthiibacter sp. F2068]
MKEALTRDHAELSDARLARRYFAKFEAITGHLGRVAAEMHEERRFSKADMTIVGRYLQGISWTFQALANKYLLTGRVEGLLGGELTIDRVESGFPVHGELLIMANDAQQAERHLRNMPEASELKDHMIRQILSELTIPTKLQFAMSQRLYYEELLTGELFWAQNDPEALWQGTVGDERRHFLVHWAVYDSQVNLPTIYLMDVEDSGRTALPKDQRRWPEAQRHLMAQGMGGLKLLTIAKGFDQDFDDLHPKRLRRIHIGPMYSSTFTSQSGPIREVLEKANAPVGDDWALAWTVEELESERVTEERSGWFGTVEREIFALDPFSGRGVDTGATRTERAIILPQRPYQVLDEMSPPGFRSVRKFVVSPNGRVLSYR